jgi:hypothetical protein
MGRRFLGFAVLALCLFLLARAAAAAPLPHAPSQAKPLLLRSQEQVGKDLIALILRADFPAARAYFDTSVRKNVTEETFRGVQTQIKELAGAAGDSVEQASTGETVAQHWGPIFFREYRFVNEVGKGAPGALINVSFNDSTSDKVLGLFIKRLVEVSKSGQISTYRGQEKTLAGAQKWSIGGQEVDVNEIVLLDFREGHMLSIKVIDKEGGSPDHARGQAEGRAHSEGGDSQGHTQAGQGGNPGPDGQDRRRLHHPRWFGRFPGPARAFGV